MEDLDDVILFLVPNMGDGFDKAVAVTALTANRSRVLEAPRPDQEQEQQTDYEQEETEDRRSEREATEIPVSDSSQVDKIVIRFSQGCKTTVGLVAGRDRQVDLVLPTIPGVSQYHFAINFDKTNIPIVKDLGSTGGTAISYDGEEAQRLSNFEWSLLGPSVASKAPVLNVTQRLQFQVILPQRDYTCPKYIKKVEKFREGTADPGELLASLVLASNRATRLPTGQQTPSARALPFTKELGKGSFGCAIYTWNMTNRDEYVVKRPREEHITQGKVNMSLWRKEAKVLGGISHDHIVAFRGATFDPFPQLEFEYLSGGTLQTCYALSEFEGAQILRQLSSALEYLHNLPTSVTHRDIKPENILVAKRADKITVKFADFGLAKQSEHLKTQCGTQMWAAPEVDLTRGKRAEVVHEPYTPGVDIWSLGVTMASVVYGGLPRWKARYDQDAAAWARAIQNHFAAIYRNERAELLALLLDAMIVEDPCERLSADYVYDKAVEIEELLAAAETIYSSGEDSDTPQASPLAGLADFEDPTTGSSIRLEFDSETKRVNEALLKSFDDYYARIKDHGLPASPCGEEAEPVYPTVVRIQPEQSPQISKLHSQPKDSQHPITVVESLGSESLVRTQDNSAEVKGDDNNAPKSHAEKEALRKRSWKSSSSGSAVSVVAVLPNEAIRGDKETMYRSHKRNKTQD